MVNRNGTAAAVRLAAWVALLAAAIWLLSVLGDGGLAAPSILDPAAWGTWSRRTEPVTAAFALLRVATLAVAWYLLGTTVIGIAARVVARSRMISVADVVAVPAVRRMLQAAFGAGLAAASLSAGSDGFVAGPRAQTVAAAAVPDGSVEMTPVREDVVMAPARFPTPPHEPADRGEDDATWTVRPGDHFWSIAEDVLARATGSQPTDEQTTEYWQRLVEANRSRLDDRGNPDLIHPGQQFELPPVGER